MSFHNYPIFKRLFGQPTLAIPYTSVRDTANSLMVNFYEGDSDLKHAIAKFAMHSAEKTLIEAGILGAPLDLIRSGNKEHLAKAAQATERLIADYRNIPLDGSLTLMVESYDFFSFICRAGEAKGEEDLTLLRMCVDFFVRIALVHVPNR